MFNFKKNTNPQQQDQSSLIQNPPTQIPDNSTSNITQISQNEPLSTIPNLDDYDPPMPSFQTDNNQIQNPIPTPNIEQPIPTPQPTQNTPFVTPSIPQPIPNLEDQLNSNIQTPNLTIQNQDETAPATSQIEESPEPVSANPDLQKEAENIMADISSFQENFNTKYDELAEKVRIILNQKIKEKPIEVSLEKTIEKSIEKPIENSVVTPVIPETQPKVDSILLEKPIPNIPSSTPPAQDNKYEEVQFPADLVQQELDQRKQDILNPTPAPEASAEPIAIETPKIINTIQDLENTDNGATPLDSITIDKKIEEPENPSNLNISAGGLK